MNKTLLLLLFNEIEKMKKINLLLAILLLTNLGMKAQINLVGAAYNPSTGMIDIVKWQALDPESVITIPSILESYYFGSSAFDAYNGNYYLTGITAEDQGLFSFNTQTNEQELSEFTLFSNITEFDMSTGKIYDLRLDSTEYISVNEFDIETGTDSLIGVIYEPGANAIVADAIGFNSNDGIIYYIGFTNEPAICLYAIPVREEAFSFSRTILLPTAPYNILTGVNYDNANDKLYALNATYDSLFNYTGNEIVEIDKETGEIYVLAELDEFTGFVGGSSSFDQNSGSFLLVGVDTSNLLRMIVFDTYTNTFETGFVPGVSEIACDNTIFALNNYIITSVTDKEEIDFGVSPNPATDRLKVSVNSTDDVLIRIFSTNGSLVISQEFSPGENIELHLDYLPSGTYLVNVLSNGMNGSKKIQVL
jgi:hypothetical protein